MKIADDLNRQARSLRREAARELRRQGYTMEAIGDRLGVSKQRVHELLNDKEKASA